MKAQNRIHKFIQLLAEQLHQQLSPAEEAEALLQSSTTLEKLLQSSIQDLPESSLKHSFLQNDSLPEFVQLLRQNLQSLKVPRKFSLQSREDRINAVRNEVDGFLKNLCDGTLHDGANFRQIFGRMLQTIDDPQLELLWSFAAAKLMQINSKTGASPTDDLNFRVTVAHNLFQCLTACTAGKSCGASVSIAALVPVIIILAEVVSKLAVTSENLLKSVKLESKSDKFALNSSKTDLGSGAKAFSKADKVAAKNLKRLVGEIIGYIAVSGKKREKLSLKRSLVGALPCCGALLSSLDVWEHEKGLNFSVEKNVGEIFPLVLASMQAALLEEDCSVEYMASVVILEASLLQLVVEVLHGRMMSKKDCGNVARGDGMRQNLRNLAVNCIGTVENVIFFDILLELLLESDLPVAFLLSQEEEVLLKGVLYEATTLVDYAFLKQSRERTLNEGKSLGDKSNKIFLNRLLVAHKAVQLFRSLGERSWAVSFSKAFSNVPVSSDLMKWISTQKKELKNYEASIQNPQALVGLLVNLDDQKRLTHILNKHPVFNANNILAEKRESDLGPNAESTVVASNPKGSKEIEDALFFIDTKGERDGEKGRSEFESVEKSFFLAARNMGTIENDGKKKRKRNKKEKISFERHIPDGLSAKENKLQEFGSDLSESEGSAIESEGFSDKPKKSRIETQELDIE